MGVHTLIKKYNFFGVEWSLGSLLPVENFIANFITFCPGVRNEPSTRRSDVDPGPVDGQRSEARQAQIRAEKVSGISINKYQV
jgi:hypothetical protein